jgi:hypothetical protein
MANTPIPIEKLSFLAYRLPVGQPGGEYAPPAAFLSLAHWFEAEKFRAFHRELFDQVMLCPSAREARRFAKAHQALWRGDWLGVRSRALACGMLYAARAEAMSTRWLGGAEDIARELAPLGLPARFLLGSCNEFVRLRDAPRFVFLGAEAAPPDVVGRRVNAVHKRAERAWTLACWTGRHGSWRIHDWAVAQHVPIMYVGADRNRLGLAGVEQLRSIHTNAVVFERRKGKAMDTVIRALRTAKLSVELDLYAEAESSELR